MKETRYYIRKIEKLYEKWCLTFNNITADQRDDEIEKLLIDFAENQANGANARSEPALPIQNVSTRFEFQSIELADWKSYVLLDKEANRVVCHFTPDNGSEYCKKMGKMIASALNGC